MRRGTCRFGLWPWTLSSFGTRFLSRKVLFFDTTVMTGHSLHILAQHERKSTRPTGNQITEQPKSCHPERVTRDNCGLPRRTAASGYAQFTSGNGMIFSRSCAKRVGRMAAKKKRRKAINNWQLDQGKEGVSQTCLSLLSLIQILSVHAELHQGTGCS